MQDGRQYRPHIGCLQVIGGKLFNNIVIPEITVPSFIDRETKRHYSVPAADLLFPMGRPQRPDWRMRCDLWVFLVRSEARVFVAGGEHGFDGLAREADDVEIEALAERFRSDELRQILAERLASRDSVDQG